MALPATDTFTTGADAALATYSASWTVIQGSLTVVAATDVVRGAGNDTDNVATWNADTFNNDQYGQVVLAGTRFEYDGPTVRGSTSAATFYVFVVGGSAVAAEVYRCVTGTYTLIASVGSGAGFAAGSVMRLEISGTTLTMYKNGSTTGMPGAVSNATIASGRAGLSIYDNLTTVLLDNWEGGNLGGGTAYNQSAGGTLTTAGTIVKATTKTFAGTLTTAGAIIKSTAKALTGTLTTAGTAIKSTAKTLAGTLTSSGALSTARTMLRDFTGTLTTAGALAKETAKTFTGALASAGAIVKQAAKSLSGTLTSSGALETALAFLLSIGGTLTTAGTLTKSTAKSLSGTLTSAGAIVRSTLKGLGGTLTPSGVLTTAKTLYRTLAGVLSFAGDVAGVLNGGSQQFFQDVGGTLATAGALAKHTTKTFVGALTSAGALAKQTAKTLAGTLSTSGALTTLRAFLISLGGTLTTSGALVKMTGKNTAGTLTPTGAISKAISRAVGGTLSFLGTLLGVLQGFVIPHLDVDISDAAVYTVTLTDSLVYSVESTDSSVYQVTIIDTSRS